jgi:la-related protein 1
MSAATQKPVGELPQAAPAFSYAQAAKGMYPSVPSALPSGKTSSEITEMTPRRTSIPDSKPVSMVSDRPMTKRTASEGRESHGGGLKTSNEPDSVSSNSGETAPTNTSLTGYPQSGGHDQAVNSTPSSPGFGTASTSTLPKEDDLFSTPNGSSDSTWEKHSQTSQNGAKTGEKVGAEKEQSVGTAWDEEPPLPVSLKEAPPPAINFWQQRKEAQDAKSKALKQVAPAAKSELATSNVRYGSMNGPPRGLDNDVDLKRQDTKKKAKGNVGPPDERTAPRAVKDGIKSADGKSRNGEEGNIMPSFLRSKLLIECRRRSSTCTITGSRKAYSNGRASTSWRCDFLANARQRAR